MRTETPGTYDDVAALLRDCAAAGEVVRARGAGTKWTWGAPVPGPGVVLSTASLDRIVSHNAGDLTAVVEAGVRLADLQAVAGEAGQMLALDPVDGEATVGGVLATGDSGPLRNRYGAPRDLVLGMTVALSDGTVAKSGGTVIKNVAGYDLGKLFTGSFGTLGVILRTALRLHPRPAHTATARGRGGDPAAVGRAALALARLPIEAEALEATWDEGAGSVVARFGGAAPTERAEEAAGVLKEAGLEIETRAGDAAPASRPEGEGALVRVTVAARHLPEALAHLAAHGAAVAGRAAHGALWARLPGGVDDVVAAVQETRDRLPGTCVVLDAPVKVKEVVDAWGPVDDGARRVMERIKARFDPAGIMAPGIFAGGI